MLSISSIDLLQTMAFTLFFLGVATTIIGITILLTRAAGREVSTLAAQTTRLVQKGLAEDVAGLVGNASALLEAVNQMVRTATGIGVFLTLLGLIFMAAACWLAFQIA